MATDERAVAFFIARLQLFYKIEEGRKHRLVIISRCLCAVAFIICGFIYQHIISNIIAPEKHL